MKLIEKAIIIASNGHFEQEDKFGEPYILHVLRVGTGFINNETRQILGILHDIVEDTSYTFEYLKCAGFGDYISSLKLLTRTSDITYVDYINKIATSGDIDAMYVKLYDLHDNTLRSRIKDFTDVKINSLLRRYHKAIEVIKVGIVELEK